VLARIHGLNSEPVSSLYWVSEELTVYNVHPRVAMDPGGGFTISWGAFLNPYAGGRARSHAGYGDAWYEPWTVTDIGANPSVGIDGAGVELIAWTATEGRRDIRIRRDGGVEMGIGGSDAGILALAVHPSGSAVITWHEDDTGGSGLLRARTLDAEGVPEGDVFTVALGTEDSDGIPAVGVSARGRIVFTWVDGPTGRIMGTWWGDPLVPVAQDNWGSLKSLWR
jgi:hypothetical protein